MYFQYRSATLFPSLLWSVAEKERGEEERGEEERGEEENHQCKIKKEPSPWKTPTNQVILC